MSVSIVMPNYNNAPFLRRCLQPLVEDAGVGEIVIYDNSSTDDSVFIAESLGPKIRVIRGGANLGATLGRHMAVMASRCEFVCFVDGDDFLGKNAVSKALEAQRQNNLDISLFQMFNVESDGENPVLAIPVSEAPIDGRTACAMTLGGWRIHIWGIIRRETYLNAWGHFSPHGYSDDELLTRHIFLAADRVGGSKGKMFYRVTHKGPGFERNRGIMRTTLAVLRLAADARLEGASVRRQRNMTVRFLIGMLRWRLQGKVPSEELLSYVAEYQSVPVPWHIADLRYWLMDVLLRLLAR